MTSPEAEPVTVIRHVPPAASVQLAGEGKVTFPALPEARENETDVPATDPVVPVTVTVQFEMAATAIEAGTHVTVVVLLAVAATTVRAPVPELAALFESPG